MSGISEILALLDDNPLFGKGGRCQVTQNNPYPICAKKIDMFWSNWAASVVGVSV